MSSYHDGRRIEYAVCHDLADNGYRVTRAASSKGFADVIAVKLGQLLLVNVKRTKMPGPDERFEPKSLAAERRHTTPPAEPQHIRDLRAVIAVLADAMSSKART